MRHITLMVGLQGSGKSTLAKDMKDTDSIILEPDAFRLVLTGQAFYKGAEDIVWATVKTVARVFLQQGNSIIVDATGIRRNTRSMWIALGKEFAGTQIDACLVLTPLDEALSRNSLRNTPVPNDVIERYARQFEMPHLNEGFDNIHVLNQNFDVIGAAKRGNAQHSGVYQELLSLGKVYSYPERIVAMQEEILA